VPNKLKNTFWVDIFIKITFFWVDIFIKTFIFWVDIFTVLKKNIIFAPDYQINLA